MSCCLLLKDIVTLIRQLLALMLIVIQVVKKTQTRVKIVVDFLSKFYSVKHQSLEFSQETLNKYFGQPTNELSRCLRSMLLISAGVDYVVGQSSLRYFINKQNLKSLADSYNAVMTSDTKNNNKQHSVLLYMSTPFHLRYQLLTCRFLSLKNYVKKGSITLFFDETHK